MSGRFWHILITESTGGLGAGIIAQDEVDTYTTHLSLPPEIEDPSSLTSKEVVYPVLGGMYEPYPIEIDEIFVRSVWRPVIAVANSWSGPNYRAFIAGDAVHQIIPTGGYGMNMGIADAYDLGWKLAAVINGTGGDGLLKSYEVERKAVAERNVAHPGMHFQVHMGLRNILCSDGANPRCVNDNTEESRQLRAQIAQYYREHDGEHEDFGIEMWYRYKSPIIVPDEPESTEPAWSRSKYTPTTWPGGRPPHLFLSIGQAVFDVTCSAETGPYSTSLRMNADKFSSCRRLRNCRCS